MSYDIFSAIHSGNIDKVKKYIKNGEASAISPTGQSPLDVACTYINIDIVKLLMTQYDYNLDSALRHTVLYATPEYYEHRIIADLLLENGTEPNQNTGWNSLMHIASQSGDIEMLKLLVRRGGDIDKAGVYNMTTMHSAVNGIINGRHECWSIIEYLNGLNTKMKYWKTEDGKTPLDMLIIINHHSVDYLRQLLQKKVMHRPLRFKGSPIR